MSKDEVLTLYKLIKDRPQKGNQNEEKKEKDWRDEEVSLK